jgi:hypothetical protein
LLFAVVPVYGQVSRPSDSEIVFLRIPGFGDSIDATNNDQTIILPPGTGLYSAQVLVRELNSGTPILGDSSGFSAGLSGVLLDVSVSGGSTTFFNEDSGFGAGDSSSPGQISGIAFGSPASGLTDLGEGVFESPIGTFDINFDGTSATFDFADGNPSGEDFGVSTDSNGFVEIDAFMDFRSATITAIPEPSSCFLLGASSVALVVRRRRR